MSNSPMVLVCKERDAQAGHGRAQPVLFGVLYSISSQDAFPDRSAALESAFWGEG